MLSLIVTFNSPRPETSNEFVDLFWNVNSKGTASGAIDEDHKINQSPIRVFPAVDPGPFWGMGGWGAGPFEAVDAVPNLTFETKPVHFGAVEIGGKERDALGNYQAGIIQYTTKVVNSTPVAPTSFRRSSFSGGQQLFTFTQSFQITV